MSRNMRARGIDSASGDTISRKYYYQGRDVKRFLTDYLDEDGPGLAALVILNNEVVLRLAHGQARLDEKKEKITADTVFDLGSLSKHFTALGILMLIDQTTIGRRYKKLEFDTTLRSIFTYLPAWAEKTKIRDLLNHSSGIPEYDVLKLGKRECELVMFYNGLSQIRGNWYKKMPGYPGVPDKTKYVTNKDALDLLAAATEAGEPGKEFAYSNTGYMVLAEVIREFTGKSLRDFLQEEVFTPLKMYDTFVYDDTVEEFKKHALCYRIKNPPCQPDHEPIECDTVFNYIHGDGNIHSTINDMEKWIKAWNHIDDPKKPDPDSNAPARKKRDKLIKMSTFLKIYSTGETLTRPKYWGVRRGYDDGSGMQLYHYNNRNVNSYAIHHGGNWLGFNSYLMRGNVHIPKLNETHETTVLVLANYHSEPGQIVFPYEIGKRIAARYWPVKGKDRYNVLDYI
ncbi:MAG TPA: serine hydrolase domain-containing protein [Blastocatellia bacterium]|nr:serine hydrolase domain-containing protein [Blastocatellia bacterium]